MERRVTYNKVMAIIFMVIASFILFVSFSIGPSINTVTGILLLIISILYMVSPAIVYDDKEIQLKNLIGMTVKRYSFSSDSITTKDRKIFVNDRKLNLALFVMARSEYDDLVSFILTKSMEENKGV